MKNKRNKFKRIMIITLVLSVMFIIPMSALEFDDYEYEIYQYKYNQDSNNISYNIFKKSNLNIVSDYNNQYFIYIASLCNITSLDLLTMAKINSTTALWANVAAYTGTGYFLWHTYDIDNNQWQSDNDYYQNNGQLITDYQEFARYMGNVIYSTSMSAVENNIVTTERFAFNINQKLYNIINSDVLGMLYKLAENSYIQFDEINRYYNIFLENYTYYVSDYIDNTDYTYLVYECEYTINLIPIFSTTRFYSTSTSEEFSIYNSLNYLLDISNWAFLPDIFRIKIVNFILATLVALFSFGLVRGVIALFIGG